MISCIEALNYKCLRYVKQAVQPLQVLVGPNASGKSTFLDVVAFLGDMLRSGPEGPEAPVRTRGRSVRELAWRYEDDRFSFAVELRLPQSIRERNKAYEFCRYEVQIGVHPEEGVGILGETLWLKRNWANAGEPVQASLFPAEPQPPRALVWPAGKHTPAGWRKVVWKSPDLRNDYFRAETTGWNAPFRSGPHRAALANLPEDTERFPAATWARTVLTRRVQVLGLNSLRMRQPCPPDSPITFRADGSNLPMVVRELGNRDPRRFHAWVEHVQSVLEGLQEIEVKERESDRHLYLAVRFGAGLTVPSWLLSDGTLRLLALTLVAYLDVPDAVYLIEEPENGLHPRTLEAVFQSLSSVYEGQVLLATHSALLLALAKPADMLCFALAPSGAADIVSGERHPRLRDWRGEVDLGVLFAGGVLG